MLLSGVLLEQLRKRGTALDTPNHLLREVADHAVGAGKHGASSAAVTGVRRFESCRSPCSVHGRGNQKLVTQKDHRQQADNERPVPGASAVEVE